MIPKVTQAHVDAAKQAGACSIPYEVGTLLTAIMQKHLVWIEESLPDLASEIAATVTIPGMRGVLPLSLLGSGYGYGYGRDIVST